MRFLKWLFGQKSTPELHEIVTGLTVMQEQLLKRSQLDAAKMEELDDEKADNTETYDFAVKHLTKLYAEQQEMLDADREAAAESEALSIKIGANIAALLGE
jgi:hypothetical protein